ncbi:DEAD/DEAH box helicase [Nocardia neocaledoniensis]|uniref:UvrD-like helicase family protein n=1 Tax=Nocardia neocaledoniensis TaxID=236511 RepID=A0A317NIK1_9NOCA|nr:ATP-binding protein [Nocardia neocaledoniensis]PWV74484.1 UvrD-like helicase family protein [Nocardia neocaledoniensis]
MAFGVDARRAGIVDFWLTTEMFNPQKVDKVDQERLMFALKDGQPLPWEPGHELAGRGLRPNQAWQHIVYLGIYQLERAGELLASVFEPDPESYDERPGGESALAAFAVGEDGRAIDDSVVLSSCGWAVATVLREGPDRDWVAEFQDSSMDFTRDWLKIVTAPESAQPQQPQSESTAGQAPPVPSKQPERRVLDVDMLVKCLETAAATIGIGAALPHAEIRIQSKVVSRKASGRAGETDFLNSFLMQDLRLVAEKVGKADIGPALAHYLLPMSEIRSSARIDVRNDLEAVAARTAPQAIPSGRWLSDPTHALALNQQLAVNTALTMPDTGIVGVNGPPGTGKTTMLRDLVAEIITHRAKRLAALSDPADAFLEQERRWKTGQYTRVVREWRPELTGFEMVVASANNGAVENVTDEIPAADAIADCWRDSAAEIEYFAEIASALLMPKDPPPPPLTDPLTGWALVAARLGNKDNRSRFADRFWYHKPDESVAAGDTEPARDWRGMRLVLEEFGQTLPALTWTQARAEFTRAVERVETLRLSRATAHQNIERQTRKQRELAGLDEMHPAVARRVAAARQRATAAAESVGVLELEADKLRRVRVEEAERAVRERVAIAEQTLQTRQAHADRIRDGRLAAAKREVEARESELRQRWDARAAHQTARPGRWKTVWTLGAARGDWRQHAAWLATEYATAQQDRQQAQDRYDDIQSELDRASDAVEQARTALESEQALAAGVSHLAFTHAPLETARCDLASAEEELEQALHAERVHDAARSACARDLATLAQQLDDSATSLGRYFPGSAWWHDREAREVTAPWTDHEWNRARSELFLASLTLHRTFLQHSAQILQRNLQAAIDILVGAAPANIPPEAAQAAWQSLFFVVPVVSTTFASYGRLFSHLGREALGWLLIDEAGQATPQSAVGALWRTKRAVVVGDPLQLEPITSLPFSAEQGIRHELGVDEQWSPSRTSVQRLADRLTALGTELPDAAGKNWVGVPLSVHRRCDQPMFDIVNTIAYDGFMINGTGSGASEKFAADYPTLPGSKWIDIVSDYAQGHWIPDEGKYLDRILRSLADLDFDMSEVMVVGPFRDISRQLRARARKYPGLVAGTVHTAQGKQADVVILVLGSNPASSGSRAWASSTPNLLNVAVSRAKRRLYVIGSRQAWGGHRYFGTLAKHLPS